MERKTNHMVPKRKKKRLLRSKHVRNTVVKDLKMYSAKFLLHNKKRILKRNKNRFVVLEKSKDIKRDHMIRCRQGAVVRS